MLLPTPLHDFFAGLAAPGAPKTIPPDLVNVARGLVRWHRDAEAQDLVGDFLLRIVEATRRGAAGSAIHLLGLSEPELRAVVRHRMRQLLAERSPLRHQVKQLRDAVRGALARGLPGARVAMPTTMTVNDKLCASEVAAATAWLLARDDAPPRDVAAIADRLRELYSDDGHAAAAVPALPCDEGAVRVDAHCFAARLKARLAPDILGALVGRVRDEALSEIAARQGLAPSTVHGRLQKAIEAVRAEAERCGFDRDVGEVALAVVAA